MDALERAKELIAEIDFSRYAIVTKPKTYEMGNGTMVMTSVFDNGVAEILHGCCKEGCKVEPHTHEQMENILIYEGEATVTVNGIRHHMTPGSTISVPPNIVHFTESTVGCRLFVCRMPPTIWSSLDDSLDSGD